MQNEMILWTSSSLLNLIIAVLFVGIGKWTKYNYLSEKLNLVKQIFETGPGFPCM